MIFSLFLKFFLHIYIYIFFICFVIVDFFVGFCLIFCTTLKLKFIFEKFVKNFTPNDFVYLVIDFFC